MTMPCPCCAGHGRQYVVLDWWSALFSFGMTALYELSMPLLCSACDGEGLFQW